MRPPVIVAKHAIQVRLQPSIQLPITSGTIVQPIVNPPKTVAMQQQPTMSQPTTIKLICSITRKFTAFYKEIRHTPVYRGNPADVFANQSAIGWTLEAYMYFK